MPTVMKAIQLSEAPERVKGCCHPVAPALPARKAETLAALLRALGDPTRIQMVDILARATEPLCVCDFTASFDLGQPTVSHHLARLREAGIVTSFKRGIWAFYRLNPEMSETARKMLTLLQ